ncbi:metallophosphoesterase [Desulfuribacillus alkaliarsenatis]|uniref:Calcineurin-like phosphoesterase domain-containing protein n=1 Tax=Desulfuribacillus alkaliarsenatis TaxID=766136 RepID=A0A1E5G5Y3_9FIRM|nr:metallophosphoesterase [Desulfuribacillus alkaliarsenatis]OEF98519.1 hypothetical protein BHF68_02320 [Desulfuribacillus alkaliarsenatis]
MAIYGISDLHLSFGSDKPMDIFGTQWKDHHAQIYTAWLSTITEQDTILIPGDTSWAMTIEEFMPDLKYLQGLPGYKIILKGNHDYWWTSIGKVRSLLGERFYAIQNDSISLNNGITIAGTRGWVCPNDRDFSEHDRKIYMREVNRLELSLKHAQQASPTTVWAMLHYMPTNDKHDRNEIIELLEAYKVERVLYGHLHSYGHDIKIEGTYWDIEFQLISCDYLNFKPKLLLP